MRRLTIAATVALMLTGGQALAGLKWVKAARVDLDGDKKKESVKLTTGKPFNPTFRLSAGAAKLEGKLTADVVTGFAVVDLDCKDQHKEILIDCCSEAGDYHHYLFVRYQNGKLITLGEYNADLPSEPAIPGNRSVRLQPWFGFYQSTVKLGLSKGKLAEVSQAMYYVGITGKPRKSPTLWRTPKAREKVGILAPGKEIKIVGYRPSPDKCKRHKMYGRKLCDWYLVKSSSGLMGWIRFEDLDAESLPWAG